MHHGPLHVRYEGLATYYDSDRGMDADNACHHVRCGPHKAALARTVPTEASWQTGGREAVVT